MNAIFLTVRRSFLLPSRWVCNAIAFGVVWFCFLVGAIERAGSSVSSSRVHHQRDTREETKLTLRAPEWWQEDKTNLHQNRLMILVGNQGGLWEDDSLGLIRISHFWQAKTGWGLIHGPSLVAQIGKRSGDIQRVLGYVFQISKSWGLRDWGLDVGIGAEYGEKVEFTRGTTTPSRVLDRGVSLMMSALVTYRVTSGTTIHLGFQENPKTGLLMIVGLGFGI